MPLARRLAVLLIAVGCLCASATADGPKATAPDFDKTVAPLLVQHCLDCHGGPKPKGGLDLSRKQAALAGGKTGVALVAGKPDESRLWEYVETDRMPPKKPLTAAEKAILKAWIAAGANWGTDPLDPFRTTTAKRAGYDWWSLQPVVKPPLPPVRNAGWARNPIDRFVLHQLEAKGLSPAEEATRRTLVRRVTLDLIGLPPTPEEMDAALSNQSPEWYEIVVERLLASPQYGVRWARHWLDVVRFGESNGFEHDEFRPSAWPYRDWVVTALNRDLPYDEFARLQLAGDVLRPDDGDALAATGFLVAGAYDSVGQKQQSEVMRNVVRQDELEDITGTVGQTFLGLTVHCARCHDHKFDPVRQAEYYRLTAALGGVRHGERNLPRPEAELAEARQRLAQWRKELEQFERPIREQIRAERKANPQAPPKPLARWDFTEGLKDRAGELHGTARGQATFGPAGLKLDGKISHVVTAPLTRDLKAKTLEAWITLDNLEQRGGGVISVQTTGGAVFDAIVFAEKESGRWLAGSDFFRRTQNFQGPVEKEALQKPVHLALVYGADGTITAYRNGEPYGKPYKTTGVTPFKAGQAEVVFGMRHSPPGGNHMLAGTILRAQLYDRALTPAEVAVSAGTGSDLISLAEIAVRLNAEQRARHAQLLAQLKELQEPPPGVGKVYAVTPKPPEVAHLLVRGDPKQRGEVVSAGGVASLVGVKADFGLPPDAADAERRKRLADWITDPKNPLFARVMVNRLWHHHFGVGLVDTPNDFGFNGGRPSHLALLDWLASELAVGASGGVNPRRPWSLKHLHRLIVTSATYRQASRSGEGARIDADNRLLWRKSPLRLEAETVRDAMLAVSGQLNPKMGGPGFLEYRITKAPGTVTNTYTPVEPIGDEFNRRTLYRTWARGGRSGLLDALDCPDPSTTTPRRAVTTTPLQALAMLNNALVLQQADRFAERLAREAPGNVDRQVRLAYLLAFARPPSDRELTLAREIVRWHGLAPVARAIFNSNEFLYVD